MKRILLAGLALWGGCTFAHAADKPPPCHALKEFKDSNKDATYTNLTPGQTNLARGMYIMDVHTPNWIPHGTAIMASKGDSRVILWVTGPLVCGFEQVNKAIDAVMANTKTGKTDEDGNEL